MNNTKTILVAPHNDDEALFMAYTIMREKPLVVIVTDSYRQFLRGDGITKEQRIEETKQAMEILGAEVEFLHIPDNQISEANLEALLKFNAEMTYAPLPEPNGNVDHNLIGGFCQKRLNNVTFYSTYTADRPYPAGTPIIPTEEERELKMKALDCYKSQLGMGNKFYFNKMRHKHECLHI